MGIQWVIGAIAELREKTAKSQVIATIAADNGKTYLLRENGFAPEARMHHVKVGDRVKFEDRQGYVLDLRHI